MLNYLDIIDARSCTAFASMGIIIVALFYRKYEINHLEKPVHWVHAKIWKPFQALNFEHVQFKNEKGLLLDNKLKELEDRVNTKSA